MTEISVKAAEVCDCSHHGELRSRESRAITRGQVQSQRCTLLTHFHQPGPSANRGTDIQNLSLWRHFSFRRLSVLPSLPIAPPSCSCLQTSLGYLAGLGLFVCAEASPVEVSGILIRLAGLSREWGESSGERVCCELP